MGFGEDLRGELFGKLGVESESDPLKLIEQGKLAKQEGNNVAAKKAFEQALTLATNQAEKYAAQNQHRSAAESYYIQALANDNLGNEDATTSSYKEVIDRLLDASKTAIAFGESARGIASATLAGMVALLDKDHQKSMEIYQNNIKVADEQENSGNLQRLLYSLGYLLDALKNGNIAAIADAQNYISTDLKPMLQGAKLTGFETLLDKVLQHTRSQLESQITMPKIQIGTSIPRDIQFNQLFEIELTLENTGEGIASDMKMQLEIPDDIEIVDGKPSEMYQNFDSGQTDTKQLTLRFQTGDSSGEQVRSVKGNVSFIDMLGNSHNQYFGPIDLEFTAVSKKEEFEEKLTQSVTPFTEIEPENLSGNVLPVVLDLYKGQLDTLQNSIMEKVQEEAFEEVEFGLSVLEKIVDQVQSLTKSNEITEKFTEQIDEVVANAQTEMKSSLEVEFNEAKSKALEELETKKNQEMEEKVQNLRAELKASHDNELNNMKEQHQTELQQANRDYETKLNQGLSQLETKLRDEFKEEKSKLKQEHEDAIQKLKGEMNGMIEEAKRETREELSTKHQAKVSELEKTIEDLKSQLV